MKSVADLLTEVPAFVGLEEAHRETIAGCGHITVIEPGEYVFREGDAANEFFAVRRGQVALEVSVPARPPLVVETLHAGDVLGWSWLFAPYRVRFDARVVEQAHVIAFDGACLRGKIDSDHDLGFELMRRFAAIITERLQFTRVRLFDVYGEGGARP